MLEMKDYDRMTRTSWFRHTNYVWNRSNINNPRNIGYLIEHIYHASPETYNDWHNYFCKNIADDDAIEAYACQFREAIFNDAKTFKEHDWTSMPLQTYKDMVLCRLEYETWIGYLGEKEVTKQLAIMISDYAGDVSVQRLSPYDDNFYAVDGLLYINNELVCGVQIKPVSYKNGQSESLLRAKKMNIDKNTRFQHKYNVSVVFCYYKVFFRGDHPVVVIDEKNRILTTITNLYEKQVS